MGQNASSSARSTSPLARQANLAARAGRHVCRAGKESFDTAVNASRNCRFVHVPRTGGSAFERYFTVEHLAHLHGRSSHCPDVVGCLHDMTVGMAMHSFGYRSAVMVIREPLEHLHSVFEYWRSGSARYPTGSHSKHTFADFFAAAPDAHSWAGRLMAGHDTQNKVVFGLHFRPQAHWLGGVQLRPSGNVRVICYGEEPLLRQRADAAFASLGLRCRLSGFARNLYSNNAVSAATNQTLRRELLAALLAREQRARAWFYRFYRDDVTLWSRHCSSGGVS